MSAKNEKLPDAVREARNLYFREWRARNRDRVREYNTRYWAKKAAAMAITEGKKNDS